MKGIRPLHIFFFVLFLVGILGGRLEPSHAQSCATKTQGDADCNGRIDLVDYESWRREFLAIATTKTADFNSDTRVDLVDFESWRRTFVGGGTTSPTPTTGGNNSYDKNIQYILASPYRNTATDNSPYLNTPSVDLYNKADLFGTSADYRGPDDNVHNRSEFAGEGDFRTMCEFSHFAYDDPIVYPSQPGAAHLHMFFGNTYMNAYSGQNPSSNDVLNKGGSTCNGEELNRTGYWVPAMIDGKTGEVRLPSKVLVYYKNFTQFEIGRSEVYPERLRMVVDKNDLHAVHNQAPANQKAFKCNTEWNSNAAGTAFEYPIPNCQSNGNQVGQNVATLEVNVQIQQCWNGQDVTNKSSMKLTTYPCQFDSAGYTRQFPHIEYKIIYPILPGENTQGWFLASDVDPMTFNLKPVGTGESNHGDWWSGWNRQVNQEFITNCNNKPADCAVGWLNGTGSRALKVRKQYVGPYKIPGAEIYKRLCPIQKNITKPGEVAYCNTAPMMSTMQH